MSKKLAAGSGQNCFDVTTGSGAFMKIQRDAKKLAKHMVAIGNMREKRPWQFNRHGGTGAIGNNMEVKEAIEVLKAEMVLEDVKEVRWR